MAEPKPELYEIEHVSHYLYASPVRHSILSLCLKPRNDRLQRLFSYEVITNPQAHLSSETDFYGNTKQIMNIYQEHQALEITSRAVVECSPPPSMPDFSDVGAWEEILSWRDSFRYWEFTHPSAFARPSPTLSSFLKELDAGPGDDPLQSLIQLSGTLFQRFRYVPGATSVLSPIEHILETGQGVCQDYAHVMIAIARTWHIPARYVSGYLYLATSGESRQMASHAWLECLLPNLGWIGFDPTNNCTADERYVRVAIGRDYQDVPPVRGVLMGGGKSRLEVSIHVRKA